MSNADVIVYTDFDANTHNIYMNVLQELSPQIYTWWMLSILVRINVIVVILRLKENIWFKLTIFSEFRKELNSVINAIMWILIHLCWSCCVSRV